MITEILVVSFALLPFSFLFTRRFAHPTTPIYVVSILTVSFYLGFYGSFLLPIDLAETKVGLSSFEIDQNSTTTTSTDDDEVVLYNSFVLNLWYFFYWSTFLLSWVILPVVQTYFESGFNSRRVSFENLVCCGLVRALYPNPSLATPHMLVFLRSGSFQRCD